MITKEDNDEILVLVPSQTDLECSEYCVKADREKCNDQNNMDEETPCRKQGSNLLCSGQCVFSLIIAFLSKLIGL